MPLLGTIRRSVAKEASGGVSRFHQTVCKRHQAAGRRRHRPSAVHEPVPITWCCTCATPRWRHSTSTVRIPVIVIS